MLGKAIRNEWSSVNKNIWGIIAALSQWCSTKTYEWIERCIYLLSKPINSTTISRISHSMIKLGTFKDQILA